MIKSIAIISILITLFLVTGISSRFDILVECSSLRQPCFKLEKKNLLPKTKSDVELNSFRVVEKKSGTWDYSNPLWAFELKPGIGLKISRFQYGETPNGFLETTRAKQLAVGVPYLAIGFGLGSTGSSEFVVEN